MTGSPNGDVLVGGAVVGGVVVIIQVLKPFILPKPVVHLNGYESKIKVLETKVENCEAEIRGLRTRCHDLGNYISELQGRMGKFERR